MCDDPQAPPATGLDRRGFLTSVGAGAAALLLPGPLPAASAAGTGWRTVLSALHVHGPDDEETASWSLQLHRAAEAGYGLVVLTPHDFRALAEGYLTSLGAARLETTATGAARQRVAVHRGESLAVLLEAEGAAPASLLSTVEQSPQARNALRTCIGGTRLRVRFAACRLAPGALVEVVVTLSDHLEGTRSLRYRFGDRPAGRALDPSRLVGLVTAPLPPAGSTAVLDLVTDAAALWPRDLATDNGLVMLGVCVTSPRRGAVADVTLDRLDIDRREHDEASVVRRTSAAVTAALPRLPGLSVHPSVEVSALQSALPHVNLFGVPQRVPSMRGVPAAELAAWYRALVGQVRAAGGVCSWNHPFGASGPGPGQLLGRAQQVAERRAVAARLLADEAYGCEVLEVGYAVRGGHDLGSHLQLWDVLSRNGRWYTGTGVNDDHRGGDWSRLTNGYGQGLLLDGAGPVGLAAVARALRAGRGFFVHPTAWPRATLDLLVDGFLPMGGIDVSPARARRLDVVVGHLPADAAVRVVQGPVDAGGLDPVVRDVASWPASAFGRTGTGMRSVSLDTSHGSFARVEVRRRGVVVAGSNPVYLLRTPGPRPLPPERTYR